MESNLVCNHMSGQQNQTTTKWEFNLVIMSMIKTELDDMKSCYNLIKTMTKFAKETTHKLHVFILKKSTVNSVKNVRQLCRHL